MTMATYKGKHLKGAGLQFTVLIHYHGSMQAAKVLERSLKFYLGIGMQHEERLTLVLS